MIIISKISNKHKIIIILVVISVASIIYLTFRVTKFLPKENIVTLPSPSSLAKEAQQNVDDYEFNQIVDTELKSAPFITKLPITNIKYTIIFDFKKNMIRVRLNSGISQENVQVEIASKLKEIGVDLQKYEVYYLH